MQDVQPELKKLQKKHKDNKEELNKEIAAFYKEKGINPLGCVVPYWYKCQFGLLCLEC